MNHKLLEKSLTVRNNQAIQKLANIDSLKEWAKTEVIPIPKVELKAVEPLSVGLHNFILQTLNSLRP